jgi:hypothetical protein
LRVPSDVTDAGCEMLEPLPPPRRKSERPPAWPRREVINAIFRVLLEHVLQLKLIRRLLSQLQALGSHIVGTRMNPSPSRMMWPVAGNGA